jgi:hypothetical protein
MPCQVLFDGPGALAADQVSLLPASAVEEGRRRGLLNPWPFRDDLLGMLRQLRPRWRTVVVGGGGVVGALLGWRAG